MAVRSEYSESKRTGVQTAHNLKVVGSNPTPATNKINALAVSRLGRFSFAEALRKQVRGIRGVVSAGFSVLELHIWAGRGMAGFGDLCRWGHEIISHSERG